MASHFSSASSSQVGYEEGVELSDLDHDGRQATRATTSNAEDHQESISYSVLFLFTNRSHAKILFLSVLAAILKGVATPASALVTGKIFGYLTSYQTGAISGHVLTHNVTQYVLYLVAIGAGTFVLQAIFYASWVAFGESQAKCAREQLFTTLLHQEVAWFDACKDGPSALIPRLNA